MAKAKKGKPETEEPEDNAEEKKSEEGAEGEAPPKKKLPILKLALFAGIPALLIVIGVGAAFFLGLFGGKKDEAHDEPGAEHHVDGKPASVDVVFFDLPEILVNLNTGGKGSSYLKLQLAIELPKDTLPAAIEPALPRIMDRFQVFLRELRLEDLAGSTGTYRMKQELLRRVQLSGLPVQVNDVLIREMIIQ